MEVQIENLTKNYGKKTALNNINLIIENGMFGLIGANGAGKTTLIRILATVLQKTSGSVIIDGIPIEKVNILRNIIGYLPQEFSLYPGFTVYETMEYFSMLSNIKINYKQNIYELLEMVNLSDVIEVKTKTLSGGMKRRLGIALALINKPKLLLVDEPTAGLDPEERMKFRNILSSFSENRIVILSTHIIGDIEETCEKLAILKNGCIAFNGTAQDLKVQTQGIIWEIEGSKNKINEMLKSQNNPYIISQLPVKEHLRVRVLSNVRPCKDAIPVEPKIEDGYVKIMHNI